MSSVYLSCKQAAKILNVSQSTIKRLCDDEALSSIRTPGGHRRISLRSVQSWQTGAGREVSLAVGAKRSPALVMNYTECCQQLLEDRRTDLSEAISIIRRRISVAELCDDILAPALVHLGCLYNRGEIETYQVHVACQRMRSLLCQISETLETSSTCRRALGATVIGDPADLSSLFAEVTLRELGWDAESLGAGLSGDSLGKAAAPRKADLVWVCHTHQLNTELTLKHNAQVKSHLPSECRLVIAGGALKPELRRTLNFDFFGDSLTHLSHYVQSQFGTQSAA
ncbi:MAG: excisionase family DNA-binding protein [Pirellulaceae bacterium]|nr:excisionase family DNA-binding protein [Pirellulaceae bacterium]